MWSSMSSVTVVPAFCAPSAIVCEVVEGDLVAVDPERLTDRGELEGDLGAPGEPGAGQPVEEGEVGLGRTFGLLAVAGVLAQMVERDLEAVADEPAGRLDRFVGGLTRDEPGDDGRRHRQGGDESREPVSSARHRAAPGVAPRWPSYVVADQYLGRWVTR